jgi:hypothetical protein
LYIVATDDPFIAERDLRRCLELFALAFTLDLGWRGRTVNIEKII